MRHDATLATGREERRRGAVNRGTRPYAATGGTPRGSSCLVYGHRGVHARCVDGYLGQSVVERQADFAAAWRVDRSDRDAIRWHCWGRDEAAMVERQADFTAAWHVRVATQANVLWSRDRPAAQAIVMDIWS